MKKVGGVQELQAATDEVQGYCDQLKSQVEEKAGTTFSVYESKSYRHQVVAGMNYFVKVHVGNGDYIHLRIYRKLDNTIELTDLKLDQKEHNELCYF